ncbi:MAG: FemAB family XrtA/PEP-CTERM system-associated protein [Pseudomonadota bacterium]
MTVLLKAVPAEIVRAPLHVEPLSASECDAWDAYVRQHPKGSFFHLYGWGEVIASAYGYQPIYLVAKRGDDIVGLAPLIDVRAPLLGRSLISTAFTVGGGPIGDDYSIIEALANAAVLLGTENNVQCIEFRGDDTKLDGWSAKAGQHAGFQMDIPKDEAECLALIPRKRRADLRKALAAEARGDLRVRFENNIEEFYLLYAASLRDLGTPIMPKRFLQEILRVFGSAVEIAFVDSKSKTVAGLLSFYFGDRVLPYYVGSAPGARSSHAHDLLYWSMMRRATVRGGAVFDFGRSKIDSGAYKYKRSWGAIPTPLTYQYKLIGAREAPNVNANNPKFKYFSNAWKKLPLPAANVLGPILAPNFP